MSDIDKIEVKLNEIYNEDINLLQHLADTYTPQELMIKPKLLNLLSKYKIERKF